METTTPQRPQVDTSAITKPSNSNGSGDGEGSAATLQCAEGSEASAAAEAATATAAETATAATAQPLPTAFQSYLRALRSAWPDAPELTITYEGLSTEVSVPAASSASGVGELPSVPKFLGERAGALVRWLSRSDSSGQTRSFRPLEPCTGIVRPGELVLVLGAPGCGKSTLLKALAGRLNPVGRTAPQQQHGSLRWNGLSGAECASVGLQLSRLTAFVDQGDIHYPLLTTRETLQFAHDNSHADVAPLQSAELAALHAHRVDAMLELMGLTECADTIVGNSYIRGVSGGQRRRIGIAEMLMGQARALFLDEISTGLDAAATFNIVRALKEWATVMRGSATMALLQPAPEVVALFDRVVLMRQGHVVFAGTHAQLDAFLAAAAVAPPPGKDRADWLVEWLAHPKAVYERDCAKRQAPLPSAGVTEQQQQQPATKQGAAETQPAAQAPLTDVSTVRFHIDADERPAHMAAVEMQQLGGHSKVAPFVPAPASSPSGPALTTAAMLRVFHASSAYLDLQAEVAASHTALSASGGGSAGPVSRSAFTEAQFYSATPHGFWHHARANIRREWTASMRNEEVLYYRVGQAIFMGLIIGSLFFDLGTEAADVTNRLGLVFLVVMLIAFSSMAEVPLVAENKLVIYKHGDAGWYSMLSFVVSVTLVSVPIAVVESLLLGTIVYFMTNFIVAAANYFFFLLVLFVVSLAMSAFFRTVAYLVPSMDVAMTVINPITGVQMLYAGFFLTRDKIKDWQIWLYWTSPFSYSVTSIALNEFQDGSRYSAEDEAAFLGLYSIPNERGLQWAGVGFLVAVALLFTAASAAALTLKRTELTSGTRRADKEEGEEEDEAETDEQQQQRQQQVAITVQPAVASSAPTKSLATFSSSQVQLPFVPVDLAWSDIRYSVRVTEQDEAGKPRTYDRALLQGISGYARTGELTALMGSSGAGKTTLMDCLAGRKEGSGQLSGRIMVNGRPQSLRTFRRQLGFVQQDDCHVGSQTVREAVEFSAQLRLPSTVTDDQRALFVTQILVDLELDAIAARLIGDATIDGLSPGELKRLTIAVEMAANPSVLFLDEPTSGLDSRAALIVLRVIRKIASRGRAVVATIHQPSAELFSRFDRVLLLQTGGRSVYFGPGGQSLVEYFLRLPVDEAAGQRRLAPPGPDTNPAVWMLGAIGAGASGAEKAALPPYADLYNASALHAANAAVIAELSAPRDHGHGPESTSASAAAASDSLYARSLVRQLVVVTRRVLVHSWRDAAFTVTKVFSTLLLGVILGIVFLQLDDSDESGMLSRVALLFSAQAFLGYTVGSSAQPVIFKLREAFYRERSSHTYAPPVYALATMLAEWPWAALQTLLFCAPLYWLVGLQAEAGTFFHFLLVCFLVALVFVHLAQFWAALMPNHAIAGMISEFVLTIFFLVSGIFIRLADIPRGWIWLYYINPLPKGFVALVVQQYHCDGADCPTVDTIEFGTVTKSDLAGYYVASSDPWQFTYIGYLVLTIAVVQIAVAAVVQRVVHQKS